MLGIIERVFLVVIINWCMGFLLGDCVDGEVGCFRGWFVFEF